jgi:ABC-type transport system involved in multi-copper enzyme maturation permease subunit
MLGPVLYLEMLLGARRGRQFVFRWLYAAWLVGQLLVCYALYRIDFRSSSLTPGGDFRPDTGATGRFLAGFLEIFVVQQFLLVLLATPAFAAGAITDEKTRGTLQHLLTAHLTAGEIVLGKLLGRLAQVAVLVLAGLPVLCFLGALGGLPPLLVLAILAATALPLFALGAASILASVWSRHTRDAVVVLYAAVAVLVLLLWGIPRLAVLLAPGAGGWGAAFVRSMDGVLRLFNPLTVLEPAWTSGDLGAVGQRLLRLLLAWGGVGVACLLLATWRLRGAYLRQLENSGVKTANGAGRRPPLAADGEPIRWREQHIAGVAPLPALRGFSTATGLVLVGLFTLFLSSCLLLWSVPSGKLIGPLDFLRVANLVDPKVAGPAFLAQGIGAMLVFSLIVGIRCSGAVSGERERQTWEALLLTPLDTRTLIRGKLWGVLYAMLPYVAAYAAPALALSILGGFVAFLWTSLWLAVTLLAMFYVGAAGLWCSVTCRNSWRSLLATLGFGYLGGFLIFTIASPATAILAWIIYLFVQMAEDVYGTTFLQTLGGFDQFLFVFFIASCVSLVLIFLAVPQWFLLNWAESWVADRERIRHWKNEHLRMRRKLPALRT